MVMHVWISINDRSTSMVDLKILSRLAKTTGKIIRSVKEYYKLYCLTVVMLNAYPIMSNLTIMISFKHMCLGCPFLFLKLPFDGII